MNTTLVMATLLVATALLLPAASAHVEVCVWGRYTSFDLGSTHSHEKDCDDPGRPVLLNAAIIDAKLLA